MRASRRANNSRRIMLKYPGLYIAVKSPVSTPTVVIPPEGEQSRVRLPTPPPTKIYCSVNISRPILHLFINIKLEISSSLDVFKVSN